jgi:hypothetical protein
MNHQKPYDQMWSIDVEARQYIVDTLAKAKGGDLPTKQCWRAVDESKLHDYISLVNYYGL